MNHSQNRFLGIDTLAPAYAGARVSIPNRIYERFLEFHFQEANHG
jgi:hypothetical protein